MVGKGCRKGLGRRPILSRAELLFGPRSPQGCNCGREMVENGSRTGACRGAILPRAQLLRGLRRAQESGPDILLAEKVRRKWGQSCAKGPREIGASPRR